MEYREQAIRLITDNGCTGITCDECLVTFMNGGKNGTCTDELSYELALKYLIKESQSNNLSIEYADSPTLKQLKFAANHAANGVINVTIDELNKIEEEYGKVVKRG